MGFFSWNCKGCGESIKAPYDLPTSIEWQNYAVVRLSHGATIIGTYDGYGRIHSHAGDEWDYGETSHEEPEMWHQRCWDKADHPQYSGPSHYSQDQGFFYANPMPHRDDYPEDMQEVGDVMDLFDDEGNLKDFNDLMP